MNQWIVINPDNVETLPSPKEQVVIAYGMNDSQRGVEDHLMFCVVKGVNVLISTEDRGRFFAKAWMRIPDLPPSVVKENPA